MRLEFQCVYVSPEGIVFNEIDASDLEQARALNAALVRRFGHPRDGVRLGVQVRVAASPWKVIELVAPGLGKGISSLIPTSPVGGSTVIMSLTPDALQRAEEAVLGLDASLDPEHAQRLVQAVLRAVSGEGAGDVRHPEG